MITCARLSSSSYTTASVHNYEVRKQFMVMPSTHVAKIHNQSSFIKVSQAIRNKFVLVLATLNLTIHYSK